MMFLEGKVVEGKETWGERVRLEMEYSWGYWYVGVVGAKKT